MGALIALHRELRGADERAELIRTCPGIAPASREACLATCTEQALAALDAAGEDVIAESFDWYVTFDERGQVDELQDARFVYGLPVPGRDR